MTRRLMTALVVGCIGVAAGLHVFSASATVPTTKSFAMLSGAQEAPGPGDANGKGVALITVRPSTNEVCVMMRWSRVDGTPSGLHIHEAPPGSPGPIVVDLSSAMATGIGCGTATDAVETALRNNPRRFYINLHTTPGFANGAIRGQLMDSDI